MIVKMRDIMKKYLQLIRVKHWIKNILIFVPMVCGKVLNSNNVYITIMGFLAFSMGASFIYIINDLKDIEKDKLHERKKKRPLASGIISKRTAKMIAGIILIVALGLNYIVTGSFLGIASYLLLGYIMINILYSYYFKNMVIIDVLILALGFVLRIYYGASLINIQVSDWLFLTILSGALFLGLGKRKKELINNSNVRESLKNYNKEFLDKFQYIMLTLTLLFYSLWAREQVNSLMIYTVVVVIVIFMRYSLIVEGQDEGDPATVLYADKPLMLLCLLYGIIMMGILL